MLLVSIADLATLTRELEELLGLERVAGLSAEEIRYLASIVNEDLPEVPDDDISRLLGRREDLELAAVRARLNQPPTNAPDDQTPTANAAERRPRNERSGRRQTSQATGATTDKSSIGPVQQELSLFR
jgi:hypothetical protein